MVYLGKWADSKVAIKLQNGIDKNEMAKFKDEVQLMCGLRPHPNVTQIYGYSFDERKDEYYMVMEFCNEGSLLSRLKMATPFSLMEKMKLLCGVARGLQHLHQSHIMYDDEVALLCAKMMEM